MDELIAQAPEPTANGFHPAIEAWRALGKGTADWSLIETLKPQKTLGQKSAVYRIGTPEVQVVAKRCRSATGAVERRIYEDILPHLPVPSLRYHGFIPEPNDEYCWLFLEFLDGPRMSRESDPHRQVAAEWLGTLHTSAAQLEAVAGLPDRGPDHYLRHLRSARTILRRIHDERDLAKARQLLTELVVRLDSLETDWGNVDEYCAEVPRTLVHGDFVAKNVRVQRRTTGLVLLPFDWETAGYGVPAADLSELDTGAYYAVVQRIWTRLSLERLRQVADIGRLFRLLASVDWSCTRLQFGWSDRTVALLGLYDARLRELIDRLARGKAGV